MYTFTLDTPLGYMRAITDKHCLYGLRFCDEVQSVSSYPQLIHNLQYELNHYFLGHLTGFSIPFQYESGTTFQQMVWKALMTIPYGQTKTYQDIARIIGRPSAVRAVGTAISKNPLQLLIPCHRVIRSDGQLGGYQAGNTRKTWLLSHES